MKTSLFLLLAGLLTSPLSAQLAVIDEPELAEEKTSSILERKIFVKGINNQTRMGISSLAGATAKELNQLLKESDGYEGERPIYIQMYEEGESEVNLGVRSRVTPFGEDDLVLQLMVDTRTEIDRSVLRHGLVEIMLYRRGLESVKTLKEGQSANVPVWLSYGLIGAIDWKKEGANRVVYEHLLARPDAFPLEKLFTTTAQDLGKFDASEKSFFHAASCSMVLALLRQNDGGGSMGDLAHEIVLFEGEIEDLLRKHFPATGIGANAMQKTWSLQLAEMATPKLIETLTLEETDKRLDEVLFLILADENGDSELTTLDQYQLLEDKELSERVQATESFRQGVIQLSNRCHPLYRPLLMDYVEISSDLVTGKFADISARLHELDQARQVFIEHDLRCRDYLDWYQISQAREVTGDFSGYRKLKLKIQREREHRKDDYIDPYLDRVQELMAH